MQVKVAKSAGFCFGVQRAVDTVYEQVEKGIRPIYTYGPIIHNEVVVQDLEEKGVRVLDSEEELEANRVEEFSSWKMLRPICYSLIKGKRLPESFQITLQLSPEENEKFLRRVKPDFPVEQLAALYLNIRYENHAASCVTGTSLKVFTLDKQIEHEWDDTVRRYFKKLQIPYVSAE